MDERTQLSCPLQFYYRSKISNQTLLHTTTKINNMSDTQEEINNLNLDRDAVVDAVADQEENLTGTLRSVKPRIQISASNQVQNWVDGTNPDESRRGERQKRKQKLARFIK